jgi:hypothetical protein
MSVGEWVALAMIFIIGRWYAIDFPKSILDSENDILQKIHRTHESCFLDCGTGPLCRMLTSTRGPSYYINSTDDHKRKRLRSCYLTFWNATHILFYLLCGFIAPSLAIPLWLAGIGFELYEQIYYGCHDYLDIIYNSLGLAAGIFLRRRYFL